MNKGEGKWAVSDSGKHGYPQYVPLVLQRENLFIGASLLEVGMKFKEEDKHNELRTSQEIFVVINLYIEILSY